MFGDFQFSVDEKSDDFLQRGVFSCYRPVDRGHADAGRSSASWWTKTGTRFCCWRTTTRRRRSTGTRSTTCPPQDSSYWSDTHQMSTYLDDYHVRLDKAARRGASRDGDDHRDLRAAARTCRRSWRRSAKTFRRNGVPIVYGTVRLIEQDDESCPGVGEAAVRVHHLQSAHRCTHPTASSARGRRSATSSTWA